MEKLIKCTCGHIHAANLTENEWVCITRACCPVCTADLPPDSDPVWDDPNFITTAQTGHKPVDLVASIIAAMDREEAEGHMTRRTVPVGMIETVTARDGGLDIDCGAAGQFRLGRDGYIY